MFQYPPRSRVQPVLVGIGPRNGVDCLRCLHCPADPRSLEAAGSRDRQDRNREETSMNDLQHVERAHLREEVPEFRPGDTVKVHVRVVEGGRERIQMFEGVVIARDGGGLSETFTVRKISFGIGVERIFPVHAPIVQKIEVTRRGQVRRAKLYYLRGRVGKAARIKERR